MKNNNYLYEAVKTLKEDRVIGIPTDTVYGLAGNAFSENAVKEIFRIKNRPLYNPLIVHTSSLDRVYEFVKSFPEELKKIAKFFWPGALTILLEKKNIPDIVTAGSKLVGVRVPKKKITQILLSMLDFPLAAPSANKFNYISPTTALHVKKSLEEVPFVLNGGRCDIGLESTIISFNGEKILIHRLGAITMEMVQASTEIKVEISANDLKNILPGSLKKHYSPNKKMLICENLEEEIKKHANKNFGVLSFYKFYDVKNIKVLSHSKNLEEAGKNLYFFLRELDEMDIEIILAENVPDYGLGVVINDKIKRAATS